MAKAFLFFGVMLSCLIACGNENTGAGPDDSFDSAKYYNPAISYGTLKDSRDGQVYRTVQIGVQTWMAENLNYDYNVGTAASYCYNDSKDSCAKYGRLYTWSAAMDSAAIFSNDGKGCGDGVTCYASGKVQGVCPALASTGYNGMERACKLCGPTNDGRRRLCIESDKRLEISQRCFWRRLGRIWLRRFTCRLHLL